MHVEFEYTQEDLIDATQRFLKRGKLGGSRVWTTAIYAGIVVGAIVFLILRHAPVKGAVFGLICAGITILAYPFLHKNEIKKRLHKITRDMMLGPGPYICQVEIRSEGVWVRQMDKQTTFEWTSLAAVEESADAVNIFTRDGSGVIVRNRAFVSDAERSRFVELARAGLSP